jgi:hypothetical protein
MDKKSLIVKWLVIGIVLFSLSITIVPSINTDTPVKSLESEDLVIVVYTDKINYQVGELVDISIYVENHGETDITLVFPTIQVADYAVNTVYWWGEGMFFPQIITHVTVPRGGQKCLLHHIWHQTSWSGNQVPAGTYQIIGWMVQSFYYPPVYAEPVYIRIGTEMTIEVQGGIGASVHITNTGVFNATNVSGRIVIKGGILNQIKKTHYYSDDILTVNETITRTYYPFGLGPILIEITASAHGADGVQFEGKTSVFLFFVSRIIPT